jgi:hypothetical protein
MLNLLLFFIKKNSTGKIKRNSLLFSNNENTMLAIVIIVIFVETFVFIVVNSMIK